ncbi:thiaminase II [Marinifilum caeruleilacunae]|uniref:Aminopyrimidine aminohydrolase n=1 Tax=Marinifilum caeruleilacunae TaxID=2499076 RepID=A0ABX1WZS2_9BACT|nr:thiaminase II [Marinifilum caeruleilacunae]NOU61411.1 thiaminase II [Marinifilum caeruleilacunae]
MKWSVEAWRRIEGIYTQILEHPFINDLMSGELEREKFNFYLQQDSLYLAEFGKVLAGIAGKLEDSEHRKAFLDFASDTVSVEQAVHQFYLSDQKKKTTASPSCLLYTSFIHKQLAAASVLEAAAAVLPCFWIYKKVGDYILANQSKEDNPYQNWIDTYGGEEFAQAVEKAISICDKLAVQASIEKRKKMWDAFVKASKMEWIFWDSAYKKEGWPV